jgi:capsular polysaccharide transport system permease protein
MTAAPRIARTEGSGPAAAVRQDRPGDGAATPGAETAPPDSGGPHGLALAGHPAGSTPPSQGAVRREAGAGQGAAPIPVRPPARPARPRRRHVAILLGFLLCVVAPVAATGRYLFTVALDQYASHAGFSVRREESDPAVEILGGITSLSGSGTSDADVLYEFIRSQEMVRLVDARIDLRRAFGRIEDPVFALWPGATIEDLAAYWPRMVKVFYDRSSGLIELRVQAFTPGDAQAIAQAIFDEATAMINAMSSIAREDATRYAREELDKSVARLVAARQALTEFRARTQIVDPAADIQGRMGLLATLEGQLVEAIIDLDLLRETTRESDQRVVQAERKVAVIEARIAAERSRFGMAGGDGTGDAAYATLVADYERLSVDLEFAEQSYLAALAAHDAALARAQRQSRYLAAYVAPTRAERAEYPRRVLLLGLAAAALFLVWSLLVLVYYAIRDRR